MDLNGIGYSNIRLPNSKSSYIYTYDSYINTFPEEVFIHEFLHSLERILKENKVKYKIIEDYEENKDLNKFINKIKKYDINNITGIKALELISELKEIIDGTR